MGFEGQLQAEQSAWALDVRTYEEQTKAENDTFKTENGDASMT